MVTQAAAQRYEKKREAISREIRRFEEDATRTQAEKNEHYTRRQVRHREDPRG